MNITTYTHPSNNITNSFNNAFSNFDQLFADIFNTSSNKYPPYNIYSNSDGSQYTFEFALAGFSRNEIEVSFDEQEYTLHINAKKIKEDNMREVYRGIAKRDIKLSFRIDTHFEITSGDYKDGILRVYASKISEEDKPKRLIEII